MIKKFLYALSLSIMLCSGNACAKHLEFMGIPIDGNITTFSENLKTKGAKPANIKQFSDSRMFNMTYDGYKCLTSVYFDEKSKNVFQCQVDISDFENENAAWNAFKKIKDNLSDMYDGVAITSDMYDDPLPDNLFTLLILEPPVKRGCPKVGNITVSINADSENPKKSTITILFEDYENTELLEGSELDDM